MNRKTCWTLWLVAATSFGAAPGQDKSPAKLWSEARWGEVGLLDSADENEAGITAVAASGDGKMLATGHAGGLVRVWNALSGIELAVLRGHRGEILAATFADEGRTVASVTTTEIMRWDAGSGKENAKTALKAGAIEHAVFTPDARTLVVATKPGRVSLFDSVEGTESMRLERPDRPVFALALAPDGAAVACGEEGGGVSIWNLKTGRVEVELSAKDLHLPRSLAFSADGRLIAVSLGRDGVLVWDRQTKERRAHLQLSPRSACGLAFSADGRGVVVGTANGTILTYDLDGPPGLATRAHAGQIQHVLFLPGQKLVTGGTDTVVRLWRAYLPGQPEMRTPEPELSARETAALVSDLGASGPAAERAARTMLYLPQQAVALLRKHLKPVVAADPKRFAALLADLESPRFALRQRAFDEMEKMGQSAKDLIHRALVAPADLETQKRLQLLEKRLENPDGSPEMRVGLRGADVLGRINSPGARRFLEELAGGVPGAHLTRAAQRALGQK